MHNLTDYSIKNGFMLGGKLKITSITLSPREVHEFKGLGKTLS